MRRIAAVTVGRSDYGIYQPILAAIEAAPDLQLQLLVSGAHLSPEFGMTVRQIEHDGHAIGARVESLLSSDSPAGIAASIGLGVSGFAQVFAGNRPDWLLVLGDRFDMFAAAVAALPFGIPVAHLHGGEVTHGALDDALRHSMTKLSHLHFVATEAYGRRVAQLGEAPERIVVCGAPALDRLQTMQFSSPETLERQFGISLRVPPLLVTMHPVTLSADHGEGELRALLAALEMVDYPTIITQANADTGSRRLTALVDEFVAGARHRWRVDAFGAQGYFSVMKCAAAMVGNSSSGLIEAPSVHLPVVNIGQRQAGRVRAANVIDVEPSVDAIVAAIERAVSAEFRDGLAGLVNPYGDGQASGVVVEHLRSVPLTPELTMKRFRDLPTGAGHVE